MSSHLYDFGTTRYYRLPVQPNATLRWDPMRDPNVSGTGRLAGVGAPVRIRGWLWSFANPASDAYATPGATFARRVSEDYRTEYFARMTPGVLSMSHVVPDDDALLALDGAARAAIEASGDLPLAYRLRQLAHA